MSTEDQTTGETQEQRGTHGPADLDAFLRDPMSLPEGADLEALAGDSAGEPQPGDAPQGGQGEQANPTNQQGDSSGDAPGTGTDGGKSKTEGENAGSKPDGAEEQAQVLSKDGKHLIPYEVLRAERERAARAELMVQDLAAKLQADRDAAENGQKSGTRSLDQIVDKDVLAQLREEAPQVADIIDNLVQANKAMDEQLRTIRPAVEESEREQRVQQVMTVEDAIAANPKLSHLRANDPAAYNDVATFDQVLRQQPRWKDEPLDKRFDAAVRMYEAAHGAIDLPGNKQATPTTPAAQPKPADTAKRVAEAVAKAAESAAGPSTLSDIPGGSPAPVEQDDALSDMSSYALTQRFMDMTPEQIEAQLARLS